MKPECSRSQAAGSLIWTSGSSEPLALAGQWGIFSVERLAAVAMAGSWVAGIMGFLKKEPALRVLGSVGSMTILLERRMSRTALATSASVGVAVEPKCFWRSA